MDPSLYMSSSSLPYYGMGAVPGMQSLPYSMMPGIGVSSPYA
jgi:hypothetical protein